VRTNRRQRLRATIFLTVGLAMIGLTLATYFSGLLDQQELETVDARFAIRGKEKTPPVVVVQIDDVTFSDLGLQWPFPRHVHGQVIDRLVRDGAKVIAVDIQFTEQTKPSEDNALFQAVARSHGRTVLATTEANPQGGTNVLGGDANLRSVGAEAGDSNFAPDQGGVIRRMAYRLDYGLKSFAVEAAERALGHDVHPFSREWIDFVGPPETIPHVSYSKVLMGKVPPSFFRGKVVVIGASAPSLQDVHDVATGSNMPGPELQANAISTAMRGFPLRSTSRALTVGLIFLLGLVAPAASLRSSLRVAIGLSLGAAALYLVLVQVLFNHGVIIPFVYPFQALALSTVGTLGVHYLMEAYERERVRDVFSRFVPEQVVDQVLERTDGDLRLGGVRLDATIMFSDLRGFTTFAETLPAEKTIEVLNHYLGSMSDAILANDGTLVAYMGDGIMAVFGAPIERPDHADNALAAAHEMLSVRLPQFNEWMRGQGIGDGFQMGIGLNTGPIMSGNVGSERRLEYTTIGDTTNTASRIEGMTKGTPHSLFVAESTKDALVNGNGPELIFYDELDVRGKQAKIRLWTLASDDSKSA
jgi:adenylate cyclase